MADIRIRANDKSSLTELSKITFEAENGENYTFEIRDLINFLVSSGNIVISNPNAGVDNHGDLQNILGDGEYHLSLSQLNWLKSQMFNVPTITTSPSILQTVKVGNNSTFNGFVSGISITSPNNTTGDLEVTPLNGATTSSANNPFVNNVTSTQTLFNVPLDATAVTSNTAGVVNVAKYTITEINNIYGNNQHSVYHKIRFSHQVHVFMTDSYLDNNTDNAYDYIDDIENGSPSNYQNIYSGLRSNNYTVSNYSLSNSSLPSKYIYMVQPNTGSFTTPKIYYGAGGITNFKLLSTFNYDFNSNNNSTSYNVFIADVNSETLVSPGSPVTISIS